MESTALLEALHELFPRVIDLSLGRMRRLLRALGNPEKNLPPVFHIAGTNGKGSTASFLAAMGEAAGMRVHFYCSPHLHRFHERIQLGTPKGRRFIDESALVCLLERVRTANAAKPITYFEITTAAAFLAFAEHEADMLVLETGLGGRLDATNMVARPSAALLTPIDMDHQDYLGQTLNAIAQEKSGIIKAGVPVIAARQRPAALQAVRAAAKKQKAPLFLQDKNWRIEEKNSGLAYGDAQGSLALPRPSMAGAFQIQNAGLALAALRVAPPAGRALPEAAFAKGIRQAYWPARMERISSGALAEKAGAHEIWLDGGHNPHAGRALAETFAALTPKKPLFILCAMQATKNIAGFLRPFGGKVKIFAVPVQSPSKMHPPETILSAAKALGLAAQSAPTLQAALTMINQQSKAPARILLCGTLAMANQPELST